MVLHTYGGCARGESVVYSRIHMVLLSSKVRYLTLEVIIENVRAGRRTWHHARATNSAAVLRSHTHTHVTSTMSLTAHAGMLRRSAFECLRFLCCKYVLVAMPTVSLHGAVLWGNTLKRDIEKHSQLVIVNESIDQRRLCLLWIGCGARGENTIHGGMCIFTVRFTQCLGRWICSSLTLNRHCGLYMVWCAHWYIHSELLVPLGIGRLLLGVSSYVSLLSIHDYFTVRVTANCRGRGGRGEEGKSIS